MVGRAGLGGLPQRQPRQAERRARPEVGGRPRRAVPAVRPGRRLRRELPARRHAAPRLRLGDAVGARSEEHTSELQSLLRISYAVFCLKNKKFYNSILPLSVTLSNYNIIYLLIK